MECVIVGGSAAGLYSAILLKKTHPDFRVRLFEKNDRFGKKLAATGNGHCNLLNKNLAPKAFHDNSLATRLFDKYPYRVLESTLLSLGVSLTSIGDLVYPTCYHAPTYARFLLDTAISLGVEVHPSCTLSSYSIKEGKVELVFSSQEVICDKVIFALGGKSQPKLGSDGSFVSEFAKHGYDIKPFAPSLCPIRVKEKVKKLSGLRHKANVVVSVSDKILYEEKGEVLFKDDGLSGIAIMNASSFLIREGEEATISLDLFPELTLEELEGRLRQAYKANPDHFLDSLFEPALKDYLLYGIRANARLEESDLPRLAKQTKSLLFHYKENYGFDQSQVSKGGISLENLGDGMESKLEKGVYFVGEMVDVDGLCGGYNLSFALASSLEVVNSL